MIQHSSAHVYIIWAAENNQRVKGNMGIQNYQKNWKTLHGATCGQGQLIMK